MSLEDSAPRTAPKLGELASAITPPTCCDGLNRVWLKRLKNSKEKPGASSVSDLRENGPALVCLPLRGDYFPATASSTGTLTMAVRRAWLEPIE
jgi:hypothetical protein